MNPRKAARVACIFAANLMVCSEVDAAVFRAYLASNGSDTNPCTLQAPCRLLPAALTAVADGGEIWMLDSANYNGAPVDITKSVTILAIPGAVGSVVATGGNAINIATAGVKVALRNLVIVVLPGGAGTGGVNMTGGAGLTVEKCLLANLPGTGISVTTAAMVRITDTIIRGNGAEGLLLQGGARATLTRATISGNAANGVFVLGNMASSTTAVDIAESTVARNAQGINLVSNHASAVLKVSVRDSRAVGNTSHGLVAASNFAASVTLSASNNVVSNNSTGIGAFNPGTKVWASGNTVSDNVAGFSNSGGALFESANDNAVNNNGAMNTFGPITTVPKM